MASSKFQDVELVNAAGDTRTATSAAQLAQFTFDGFYVDDEVQLAEAKEAAKAAEEKAAAKEAARAAEEKAAEEKAAKAAPAGKPAASGNTAVGEKTTGSNPS